jgi:hypothetical protein
MDYIELTISEKNNVPCLWESGGRVSRNTGCSRIIVRSDGQPPNAMFVRAPKHEHSCGDHALIPIIKNMIVVRVDAHNEQIQLYVSRIEAVERENTRVGLVDIFQYTGPYEELKQALMREGYEHLTRAADVAYSKAQCHGCEKPHYVRIKGIVSRNWVDVVRWYDYQETPDEVEFKQRRLMK